MSSNIYKVAIVGAGRIGCGFDTPESSHVLTHAHAICNDPRLELAAIVDSDAGKKSEAEKWGTQFFTDIETMWTAVKPDIVVIATPDATHAALLEQIAGRSPRLIICEKPVATNESEAAELRKGNAGHVPIIVNFSRRFDTTVQEIGSDIAAGKFGKVLSASGTYTKGIFHNGSHMLDLARYLFGEMTSTHAYASVPDFPEGESTIGAMLSFERCPQFHLVAADARAYAIFELDILTEKARIRFVDEGSRLITQDVIDDPLYAGFRILGEERIQETGLSHALAQLMTRAVAVLDGAAKPQPSLDDALKTHAACAAIVETLKSA
jgi:predicted dehydrogenase